MGLEMEVIHSDGKNIQMCRYDEMFECGKGITVMMPFGGGIFVPAYGRKNYGIDYLLQEIATYNLNVPEYKIRQAYTKLMLGDAYTHVNIKI